uniref:DDHD domain-containing protein n=1 Tax=Heterorhabditis bacteriophora TaxID=37862 RepID=A0A1I7W7B8_HETBA
MTSEEVIMPSSVTKKTEDHGDATTTQEFGFNALFPILGTSCCSIYVLAITCSSLYFRLNDDQRRIEAIYWKHDSCEVRRGTWFTQVGMIFFSFCKFVRIINISFKYIFTLIKFRYIGWGKSQALRRGYHREAEWADEPAEITHLVLVVHGIGQKGYENLIAENAQQ